MPRIPCAAPVRCSRALQELQQALALLSAYITRLIDESTVATEMATLQLTGASDTELRSFLRLFHRSPPIRNVCMSPTKTLGRQGGRGTCAGSPSHAVVPHASQAVDLEGRPLPFHEAALAGFPPHEALSADVSPSPPLARAAAHASATHRLDTHATAAPVEHAVEPRFLDGIQFNCQINVKELLFLRSERLALLQTTFPLVHWMSMVLLGASIVGCFLITTDEKALQFLDFLQLRLLFTILVGALSGITSICIDMNDPYSGSFRITPSAAQLYVIRAMVEAEYDQAGCWVDARGTGS